MVPSGTTDLVQDMTGDCSLVASLCAGMARAEAGHTKVGIVCMAGQKFTDPAR